MPSWFWDTMWRWFGERDPPPPPIPRDENMRGLGWRGDRRDVRPFSPPRSDAGQDIRTKHENIRGLDNED